MKIIKVRITFVAVVLAAIMLFGGTAVFADTFLPPEPFEIWSEDGTMVFRWDPGPEENWSRGGTAYAGVYKDGELLYSIENLPLMGESALSFLFSGDFRFLVFKPAVCQVAALGFFENGVLLRSYRIDELVRDMSVVRYTVSTASWDNHLERYFDTTNNTLTIVTRDDKKYIFDITTGEIIYDTAGDAEFIPHREDTWGFFIQESPLPLWAITEDTPSPWSQDTVERAGDLGLLPAPFRYGFRRATTRAEFAAISITLYEHFGEPVTGRITFTDTDDINVEKAAYLGIVTGVGNNRFDPYSPITLEQAAVVLSRLSEVMGQQLPFWCRETYPVEFEFLIYYLNISLWAVTSVAQIYFTGIMIGIGDRFDPRGAYTREQSIVSIMRIFDRIEPSP